MPGFFGALGCNEFSCEKLESAFYQVWGSGETLKLPNGILGGHTFGAGKSIRTIKHLNVALDGEASIYDSDERLFNLSTENLTLTPACRGNIAVFDTQHACCYLAANWTGSFPLYYSHHPRDGLVFCTRVKPLVSVINASPDLIAVREFLHDLSMLCGRTFYKCIHRLMPGQSLKYDACSDSLRISETSRAWVGIDARKRKTIAIAAWESLTRAIRHTSDSNLPAAIMMSGGWDSRTVLAAMSACLPATKISAYYHGDLRSREMRLASRICQVVGVPFHAEPLDAKLFDLDFLKQCFDSIETTIFPEWYRAGRLLSTLGVKSVSAGVYGEVLGGHYGTPPDGRKKLLSIAGRHIGLHLHTRQDIRDLLRLRHLVVPWYIREDFWEEDPKEAINADIEETLARFKNRGIDSTEQLIEAFITEHRGSQYINSQMLSCRAFIDISLPFGDQESFVLASRIPLNTKLYNALNREILLQHAPELLKFSTASTLVPARMPVVIQETSRLIRHTIDGLIWRAHFATFRKVNPPLRGWWNWDFLQNDDRLEILAEDLRGDYWNKNAILKRIKELKSSNLRFDSVNRVGILTQTLLKIYTTDLMLR